MLEYLKDEANRTLTENGAATLQTTKSDCLDLFSAIGALRRQEDREIIDRFARAYCEDPDLAMKTLFFARDIRGGLGERNVFRTILRWLAKNKASSVGKNLPYIAEYGRWDDLLVLLGTPAQQAAIDCLHTQLVRDLTALENGGEVSLLAKWLPSVNTSNKDAVQNAKLLARAFGMTEAQYRKTLVKLRAHIRILENNLREKDYTFDYAKQPSRAMLKYRKAFLRNDGERYQDFLNKVSRGEATLHTGTLTPYDIVLPLFRGKVGEDELSALDTAWNAQEDFTGGENALVVVDGSGSMYGGGDPLPAAVAESLAIYFAERNTGAFKDHFITFSEHPQLVQIKGSNIHEKLRYCMSYNECANTNLQAVFELLLNTAVKYHLPQQELPAKLYIITDMEFDWCAEDAELTNFEYARKLFASAGYTLPEVIFWNVDSRNRQQPVKFNEQGVALISGSSPQIFGLIRDGIVDPYSFMLHTLRSERYAVIAA